MDNLSSKVPKYLIHESFTISDIVINQLMIDEGIKPTYENFLNYKEKHNERMDVGRKVLDKICDDFDKSNISKKYEVLK